jgi:SAM-dependent methyltransferase
VTNDYVVTDRVIISPQGKALSLSSMEHVFDDAGAKYETIFRRLEFNQVIQYTSGIGVDIGCGLNKIHSVAIGIDFRLENKDFGYPFGANIKLPKNNEYIPLPWFQDESLDFVFSSHCLEHLSDPQKCVREAVRVLKRDGYLILILPDTTYYPHKNENSANTDHKWDPFPDLLADLVKDTELKCIQINTLHDKLINVPLTERDERIRNHYHHKSLNFSFEGIFQKQ